MQTDAFPARPVIGWGRIDVERLGGLAGYGMPDSRLRSRGHVMAEDLSATDLTAVGELFLRPAETPGWVRDAFRYYLTRQSDCGPQTVIVPEISVPEAIRNCVRDELTDP